MKHYPHVVVEIRLVAHGYQADIYDNTMSTEPVRVCADVANGVIHSIECHDFADSKPSICDRAEQFVAAITKAIKSIR